MARPEPTGRYIPCQGLGAFGGTVREVEDQHIGATGVRVHDGIRV